METADRYQERYLAHQLKKKETLIKIMKERHSNRIFSDAAIEDKTIELLKKCVFMCPSSCDRQGVRLMLVKDRDDKALLGGLLVGGVGWIHRAPYIFLLFADPLAYKAGEEIKFMPYLDAGVVIQQLYLSATALGLHCAYANPNIRMANKEHFKSIFGEGIFCGAFAFGHKP